LKSIETPEISKNVKSEPSLDSVDLKRDRVYAAERGNQTVPIPSGGSFSYFVTFDVLKTPFILTAARLTIRKNYVTSKNDDG